MPLARRPQTAAVEAVAATVSSSEITAYTFGSPTNIRGQLTEKSPQQALEGWGIDTEFPAVWLCNQSDASSIKVGDRMTINTRVYIVLAGPQIMDAESRTSHARYLVQRYS